MARFSSHSWILAGVVISIIHAAPIFAAEWRVDKGLRVGEVYSDNVQLEDSGKEGDWATVISPNIDIGAKGARASFDIKAAFEYNSLGGSSDSFNPQLQANGEAEVIEDFFFIEADASARQSATDPFSSYSDTNISQRGNTTTTYDYSVSPYILSRINDFATIELRYRYDEQIGRGNDIDDSSRDAYSLNISSGSDFTQFTWGLTGSYRQTEYDDQVGAISPSEDSNNEFISSSANVGYRLTRKWQLTSSFGKEWNDFISQGGDLDDTRWDAGLVWTPTPRTSVDVGYGERFFGSNPRAKISHRHRRSTLELSYTKELTDSRSLRQDGDVFSGTDSFGAPTNPFFRDLLNTTDNLTTADNATVVDERFEASFSLKGNRTTLTLEGDYSKQTRQDSSQDSIFSGLSVSVDRQLSAHLSVDIGYDWDKRENRTANEESTTNRYRFSLTRQLGAHTDLTFDYTFSDRDTEGLNDEFNSNRLSIFLSIDF